MRIYELYSVRVALETPDARARIALADDEMVEAVTRQTGRWVEVMIGRYVDTTVTVDESARLTDYTL